MNTCKAVFSKFATWNKVILLAALLLLILTGAACKPQAESSVLTPTPVETDACCSQTPAGLNATLAADPTTQPTLQFTATPAVIADAAQSRAVELEPGMYPFTNANVIRDVVVHEGVAYAATLGGMTTWTLDTGEFFRYTPLDGMGHVSANAIVYCEIPEPRILVGTLSGISVFDPATKEWKENLSFPADSRVATSKIERLYCDQANNRLLIGYMGLGVYDLKLGEFQRFTQNEGLLWNSISDIAVNGKEIWVASGYKGIAQIMDGRVTTFSAAEGIPDEIILSLAFAKDGTLWLGASSGLISFKAGQWTAHNSEALASLRSVNELEIAPDGSIWAATLTTGPGRLCNLVPGKETCATSYDDSEGQGIQALALTENGSPVFGTGKGLYLFENGAAAALQTDDQLASNYVDSFASDPDGRLWVGTDAGIHLFNPAEPGQPWKTFRQREVPQMGGNWGKAIAAGTDGSIWIVMTNGSASRYQNGTWTTSKDIYSFDTVTIDREGRAWFGDDSKGVVVINPDGSKALALTTAEGLPGNNVQAILTDEQGQVWIGTDQGLALYRSGDLKVVFGPDSRDLPNKYIRALAISPDGSLIIGTFTGVARYDGNTVEVLVDFMKDGFTEARLTTLAAAPDGQIWIGTDRGLLTETETGWKLLTTRDGLLTNFISALHVDPTGTIWVGGGGSNFDGGGMIQIVP